MPSNNRGLECPRCLGPTKVIDTRYNEETHKRMRHYACKDDTCGWSYVHEAGLPAHLYGELDSDLILREELAIIRRYSEEAGYLSPRRRSDLSPLELWLVNRLAREVLS